MAAFSSGASSIRNVRFDVATEDCHLSSFAMPCDALFCLLHKLIKFLLRHSVLPQRVVIGMDFYRTKSDHLIAVQNADVFAFGGALEERGQIYPGLRG